MTAADPTLTRRMPPSGKSASLPTQTLVRFALWNVAGLAFYFLYSRSRSQALQEQQAGA